MIFVANPVVSCFESAIFFSSSHLTHLLQSKLRYKSTTNVAVKHWNEEVIALKHSDID